jgi:hypothetical protein
VVARAAAERAAALGRGAAQAAAAHYWEPCPSSVVALRTAAAVLREEAERLAVAS